MQMSKIKWWNQKINNTSIGWSFLFVDDFFVLNKTEVDYEMCTLKPKSNFLKIQQFSAADSEQRPAYLNTGFRSLQVYTKVKIFYLSYHKIVSQNYLYFISIHETIPIEKCFLKVLDYA